MDKRQCPCGKGMMERVDRTQGVTFRGVEMEVTCQNYVCPHCGLTSGCVADVHEAQLAMAEAYRRKTGLLTGAEIRAHRHTRQLSREALAQRIEVTPETIEGWEEGLVQPPEMDQRLREAFSREP